MSNKINFWGRKLLLISSIFSIATFTEAKTVNLKLLVIASGTAEQDSGLDYIDDILDDMGVPYDVLDASQTALTKDMLITDNKGNYNGIILTDTFMHYEGPNNYQDSALTLQEWKLLHQYERDFNVRESVISGYPVSGEYYRQNYDLDYGMDLTTLVEGTSFSADWQVPVGQGEFYEYVNKQTPLAINDYAVAVDPSNDPQGPVVVPLLKDSATNKTMISEITYPDGRKVLLSTIANASYLLYSQILNYEFVNYATQGVFIGGRKIYLAAHVDDLFAADALWDPVTNENHISNEYRNSAASIHNTALSQYLFTQQHPNFSGFKLDFAFNGGYATLPTNRQVSIGATNDTYLSTRTPHHTHVQRRIAKVKHSRFAKRRALFNFDVEKDTTVVQAILKLVTKKKWYGFFFRGRGKICLTNKTWDSNATWYRKDAISNWRHPGGDFKKNHCVNYQEQWGSITADITPLVNHWQTTNATKLGLIFIGTNNITTKIFTSEAGSRRQPKLDVHYMGSEDDLVTAILETKNQFRFLNHTLTHRDMYTSSGATYAIAKHEIAENLRVWQQMDLPGFEIGAQTLVTGNHSGLEDTESSNVPSPVYIPYPQGRNLDLMDVIEDLGIKYMASDTSQVNQDQVAYIPNTSILMLPRYPTSVFYNVTTPEALTDEYNYIYHESFIERGIDPCVDPAAICQPLTYQQILEQQAINAVRHMLSYKSYPHYFHISNLKNYRDGATLQFDWLNAVAERYNMFIDLPVKNLDFYDIGELSKNKLASKSANVRGFWNRDNNTVTITADDNVSAQITGIKDGEIYGGQNIIQTDVGRYQNVLTVDRRLH
ncbi:MAG: DNRLRE domain-containing protein [Gammaproteobacteria bacterium]|nr:DNRLRE domain-containing protein [Gammaproteobacteria bacterium]